MRQFDSVNDRQSETAVLRSILQLFRNVRSGIRRAVATRTTARSSRRRQLRRWEAESFECRCLLAATFGLITDTTDITEGSYLVHGMVLDANGIHLGGQTFTANDFRGDPVTFNAGIVDGVFQGEDLQVLLQDIERSSGQNYPVGYGSAYPFLDQLGLAWLVQSARTESDLTNQGAGFEIGRNGSFTQIPQAFASYSEYNLTHHSEIPVVYTGNDIAYFWDSQWHEVEVIDPDGYNAVNGSVWFEESVWTTGVITDSSGNSVGAVWKDQALIPFVDPVGFTTYGFYRLNEHNGALYGIAAEGDPDAYSPALVKFDTSGSALTYSVVTRLPDNSYVSDIDSVGTSLLITVNGIAGVEDIADRATYSSVYVAGTNTVITGESLIGAPGIVNQIAVGNDGIVVQSYNLDGTIRLTAFNRLAKVDGRSIVGLPFESDVASTTTWEPIPAATGYQVWINDLNSKTVVLNTTVSDASAQLPDGLPAGRYAVWIRPMDRFGLPSDWTPPLTFNVYHDAILVNPLATLDATPVISWAGAADGDFDVFVSVKGQSAAVHRQMVTGNSLELPKLARGLYTVWVRKIHGDGSRSLWSSGATLDVAERPETSLAGSVLSWNSYASAVNYELWVSTGSTTDRIAISPTFVSTLTVDLSSLGLSAGSYRVWIRAVSSGSAEFFATSRWSHAKAFTV